MDDFMLAAGLLLAMRAWDAWSKGPLKAIEQKGADLFETLHPSQKGHAADLPAKALTRSQLDSLNAATGFPDPKFATAIALAESGGVPNALGDIRNGEPISIGLFQINIKAHPQYTRKDMSDPIKNAKAAFAISKGGTDWTPWSTFMSLRYAKFYKP